MAGLLIGKVAERTGLTAATIRHYESLGLVTAPVRSSSGYRRYSDSTIEELSFIKKAQALGFSLDEIRDILTLSRAGQRTCAHVLDLARRHLAAVEERIQRLERFRAQLAGRIGEVDCEPPPSCEGPCDIIAAVNESSVEPISFEPRTRVPRRVHRRQPVSDSHP